MRLPSDEIFRAGLKRWRTMHNMTAEHVAAESRRKELGIRSFRRAQVNSWENGLTRISYTALVEQILPAYHIEDFDTFIDFCRVPSCDDITVINKDDFGKNPIAPGTIARSIGIDFLGNHRTRIDRVTFSPGTKKPTRWAPHDGHEFVVVLKGSVTCEFAVEEHGEIKAFTLDTDMAIMFPSALYHRFYNASNDVEAELVAAKPSFSGTAAAKR